MGVLTISRDGTMEQTNPPPLDRKSSAALVVRAVDTIDARTKDERDALLSELLRTAWGSIWAQNQ
jgi:hypothetical protein